MSSAEIIKAAEACWRVGISALPFRIKGDGTVVGPREWSKYCDNPPGKSDQDKFRQNFLNGDSGLFIACGRVHSGRRMVCLDVDDNRFVPLLEATLGPTVSGRFGSKGIGVFVWVDVAEKALKTSDQIKTTEGNIAIELLNRGRGTFIAPGIHRSTGRPYQLRGAPLWESLEQLPELTIELWRVIETCCRSAHALTLLAGKETHEALVGMCRQLVSKSEDDELLRRVVRSLFGPSYTGKNNAHDEILRTLKDAREKGFARESGDYPQETMDKLNAFNKTHCVVDMKGKTYVLSLHYDESLERQCYEYSRKNDLFDFYLDEIVTVPGKEGKPTTKGLGEAWFKWTQRAKANRIEMLPNKDPGLIKIGNQSVFNMWQGFRVEAREGEWRTLEYHLREIICDGNSKHYEYLLRWLARCVQHPEKPGEVAVVMRGGRGAGKGMFGRMLERIFGQHYFQTAFQGQVAGRFNAHLRDVVVLFGDEAFFAGDKKHESVLKALVTEPTLPIEAKFVDVETVRNRLHIVMATNESWAVPAGTDERRFFVLDVSEKKKQDKNYFKSLVAAIKGEELSAMLAHLLNMGLSDFEVREVPQTDALADQKMQSLNSVEQWLLQKLMEGVQTAELCPQSWAPFVSTKDLYADSTKSIGGQRVWITKDSEFVKSLKKILKVEHVRRVSDNIRVRGLVFEDLQTCRERFDKHVGFHVEWPDESNDEPPNPDFLDRPI